jgi:hypothetical protein
MSDAVSPDACVASVREARRRTSRIGSAFGQRWSAAAVISLTFFPGGSSHADAASAASAR